MNGFGRSWTLRKVVMHHQKKSINKVLEEAMIKQGSAEMIEFYQKVVNTVMKSLTAEEIQEAEALATEWNEKQPPWDVQSKKAINMLRNFAKEMWKWSGARVVVMVAWEDANGEVIVGIHDFNDELGNGKLFEELDKCWGKFINFKKWRDAGGSLQMPVAETNSSGVRMGAKQDLDGTPDHSAGERMMDRMMQGTSMVDEDATEAVLLPDSQQQIARCQVADGNTCQPIAIGKEPPNAWQQVVGGNTSPVQPMPEGHHTDLPDSLQLADPSAVPMTIKRAHKQENSKHKLPIPSMSHTHAPDQHRQCEGYVAIKMGVEDTKVA
ncbi:hypothetical protein F5J12DRAFT_781999 [Pisolithus orientalis]|uniref:uncharacterized protein n=1 Tax=Pisolithus orientalis TaxID=936130 RepID=UPI002223F1A7|nr:uncharacterized protein F5J12DRAFT_781999 [Pisolithus orientalis]KAI6009459.1 hypothetical protein F5J12DRAFT_781999 [Pisolithus orientalis]